MRFARAVLPLLAPALLFAAGCGGPPLQSKEDCARALAQASVPSIGTKGALLSTLAQGALPEASFSVPGAGGGEAKVSINAVGAIVGFAAQGVLFDVDFRGFSEDGQNRLDGKLSVMATFEYLAAQGEDPFADVKLSLVGKVNLSGAFSDELNLNVKLITRFHDLSFREESVSLRLDGKVTSSRETFVFTEEDLQLPWKQPTGS